MFRWEFLQTLRKIFSLEHLKHSFLRLSFFLQAYDTKNCTIPYDEAKTKIPGNIVNPYTPERLQLLLNLRISVPFTKEEIAASVFNQMLLVLDTMEEDLDHRRKCLE